MIVYTSQAQILFKELVNNWMSWSLNITEKNNI